jgi:hypothetical protein
MTDRLPFAGAPARSRLFLGAVAALLAALMLPMAAEATPAVVKGIGNAADALGDIGKGLDINPGLFPDVPTTAPTFKVPGPPLSAPGGGGWVTPPGGQIGKLPPAPGPAPTPPVRSTLLPPPGAGDRALPPIILDLPPGRAVPPLDPAGPPIKYTGVGPQNVPVRKVAPEVSTGIGVRHEPNPFNFPVPVKVDPNAPVKLPGNPIASTPPARVNLPPTPVRVNTPSANPPPVGPPPQALLKLYGEDEATRALNAMRKSSMLKRAAQAAGIGALGTLGVGVAVAVVGGIYVAIECNDKNLDSCLEHLGLKQDPADGGVPLNYNVTIENHTAGMLSVTLLGSDGSEVPLASPEAPGTSVTVLVAADSRLNVYKDGIFFQTYGVENQDWTIPIR